jgi:uncharacterized membrane protein
MPYQWRPDEGEIRHLHLWPHRSLPPQGFVWFIGGTAALFALPLITQLGTAGLWMLLPFLLSALAAIWVALRQSYKLVTEDLTLSRDLIAVKRHSPRGKDQSWQANPHWVRLTLHATGGPVPQYLTMNGSGREVELGAFLTPEERREIYALLSQQLDALKQADPVRDR